MLLPSVNFSEATLALDWFCIESLYGLYDMDSSSPALHKNSLELGSRIRFNPVLGVHIFHEIHLEKISLKTIPRDEKIVE